MPSWAADVLFVIGLTLVTAGILAVYWPAALIFAGIVWCAIGWRVHGRTTA